MSKSNLAEKSYPAEESWKDTLKDICEVARNSLHNLVSTGTPPLPRCYHQEFVQAADILKKQTILDMVRSDEDSQAVRFRRVILKARDRISDARKILSEFEEEARRNIAHLDNRIDTMKLHLVDLPEEKKRDIEGSVSAIRASNSDFVENISGVLEQIGKQENLLASLAKKVHEDPLTGVLNRRAWERDLKEACSEAESDRKSSMLALDIADLDDFKNVNDSYGHPVGDAVLKQFAALLADHFASSGSVYRYGGEEFGIILPGFSGQEAAERLEVFRKRLKRAVFVAMNGEVKIRISASYGVAQWTGQENMKDVVSRADQMLYKAKKAGKDCIILHQE